MRTRWLGSFIVMLVLLQQFYTMLRTTWGGEQGEELLNDILDSSNTPKEQTNHWWWRDQQFDTSNLTHPYMGAIFQGTPGWIVNPDTARLRPLNNNYWNASLTCPTSSTIGIEGVGGHKVLQKVRSGMAKSREQWKQRNSTPTLLCMIYSIDTQERALGAIVDTWGRQCDGFWVGSNTTRHDLGEINIAHAGPEAYGNMWQKIRSMWAYAQHFDFDWYYIAGDDVYAVVDHLRAFLVSDTVQKLENGHVDSISRVFYARNNQTRAISKRRPRPLLLSTPMMVGSGQVALAGGSGYIMNRAGVQLFGEIMDRCHANDVTSQEDIYITRCLSKAGLYISDTRDDTGAFRFGTCAECIYNFRGRASPMRPRVVEKTFQWKIPRGFDHASDQLIGFHLKGVKQYIPRHLLPDLMLRYHAIVHDQCRNGTTEQESVSEVAVS